jgi:hypothetical protein
MTFWADRQLSGQNGLSSKADELELEMPRSSNGLTIHNKSGAALRPVE